MKWIRNEWPGVLGVGVLLALAIWLREESLLAPGPYNPDEAELLAEGKRSTLSWVPYATTTDSTHLFLWPFVLGLFARFGFALNLSFAHLLSAVLLLVMLTSSWWVLHRRIGVLLAGLAVGGPAVVLLSARYSNDFLSLSSEMLPLALLSVALLVAFGSRSPLTPVRLVTAVAICGLAPLAKPQVLPLAFVLAATFAWAGARAPLASRRRQAWILGGVGFIAPTLLTGIVLAAAGTLGEFLTEPIAFQLDYLQNREELQPGIDHSIAARISGLADYTPAFLITLLPLACAGMPGRGSFALGPQWWDNEIRQRSGLVVLAATYASGVLAAVGSAPYVPHYSLLIYGGALLGAAASSAVAAPAITPAPRLPSGPYGWAGFPVIALLSAFCIVPALSNLLRMPSFPDGWNRVIAATDDRPSQDPSDPYSTLTRRCPPGSSVFVWGWANEMYSFFQWSPGSRYVTSTWQLWPLRYRDAYRARLIEELREDPPTCIVNAVGPSFFGGFPESATIEGELPGSRPLLQRCYRREVVSIPGQRFSVWVQDRSCAAPAKISERSPGA